MSLTQVEILVYLQNGEQVVKEDVGRLGKTVPRIQKEGTYIQ